MTVSRNVSETWEDLGEKDAFPQAGPMIELGVTGIKRSGGYIDEEFLPALRGRKAVRVFREMAANDSMVGALLFAIDKLIREVDWKVIPADQTPEQTKAQKFVEECMEDMSHSWDDFIGEILTMLTYGWSWHEVVYKKRVGPWERDPKRKSKYSDNMIGWRKIPIRAQETLMRWSFDESGGIRGMIQMAPPSYKQTAIPIEKSLLFRTSIAKGNPEGVSLLRTAYRSWYFKKRLEEFEAIGVERDLAGMPVAKVPADFLNAQPGTPQAKTVAAFKKMVRGVRRDENEGLVLPTQYDPETKQPMYEFELMSSSGTRQFDTNSIIQRYEQRILMSVLADFILVGHQQVGSYALHTDKTGIFRAALNAITKAIADTLNRHAIPRLFEVNNWKLDELPKFEPTDIDPPDLNQLAQFISATAGAGMQWFPDPELEKFVRDVARLPEMTDETVEYKRQMLYQTQAMEFAQNQMGLLGMQQKAELTAQGFSPEQAEMAAQAATPEMQAYQAHGEMEAEATRRAHPVGQEDRAREDEQLAMQYQQAEAQGPQQMALNDQQFRISEAQAETQRRMAEEQHGREKEKMTLQEVLEQKKHQREVERLKHTDKAEGEKHKRDLKQMEAQARAGDAKTKQAILQSKATEQAARAKRFTPRPEKNKKKKS